MTRRGARERHPRGAAGPRDVRPHRRRLRPHERGDDRRDARALARARGRPGRARRRATGRSTWPPAPATSRSSCERRVGPRGEVVGVDFPSGCSSWRAAKAPGHPLRAGQRAGAGLRRRRVRRRDRGLRRAQLLRPRARPGGDGARGQARRAGRRARDHDARRSRRCPWFFSLWFDRVVPRLGPAGGRPGRLHATCPSSVRRFPARATWPPSWRRRASRTCAGCVTARRHHRHPRGPQARERRHALASSSARCSRPAGPSSRACCSRAEAPPGRGRREPRPGRWPSTRRARWPPGASACGRCSCSSAAATATTRLVAAAVAVELLHMATLVHDDVLDRAPLRRGRPTVFAAGGRERGHRHGRPPLLARVRRAGRDRQRGRPCAPSPRPRRASPAAS